MERESIFLRIRVFFFSFFLNFEFLKNIRPLGVILLLFLFSNGNLIVTYYFKKSVTYLMFFFCHCWIAFFFFFGFFLPFKRKNRVRISKPNSTVLGLVWMPRKVRGRKKKILED